MATKLFVVLSALALLSVVAARVTRDAPKEDIFVELWNNVEQVFKDAHEAVLKTANVENGEQLQQKALDGGKVLAGKFDEWTKDIIAKTEALKENPHVKALREEVDKHIEEFKLNNPGTSADLKAFAEKTKKASDDILVKLKDLQSSDEAKSVQDALKKIGEEIGEKTAETFKSLPEALKEIK